MENLLHGCLAQFSSKYVLKEEQYQAVLGLQWQKGPKGCCGGSVLPTGFGKSLI